MGYLHFWTDKINSKTPLESNLGCTMHLNNTRDITMHRDIWNYSLMLVNWVFLFLYVGWTTPGLIPLTPLSTSMRCAMRYISCIRYGTMGKAGRSQTPLMVCFNFFESFCESPRQFYELAPSATSYIPICVRGQIALLCNLWRRLLHARLECFSHKTEAASGSTKS